MSWLVAGWVVGYDWGAAEGMIGPWALEQLIPDDHHILACHRTTIYDEYGGRFYSILLNSFFHMLS